MSGLKCLKCGDGFYLPDKPLDCASGWTCYKCKAESPKVRLYIYFKYRIKYRCFQGTKS